MKKSVFLLALFFFTGYLFCEKAATLSEILKPGLIVVDQDQIFITEGAKIYVYSAKDFSLQVKFGKEGEGPQEFKVGSAPGGRLEVIPQPDYILVNSLNKVSFFSRKGEFKKEIRARSGIFFSPLADKFVGRGYLREDDKDCFTFNLYDSKLDFMKEVYRLEVVRKGPQFNAYPAPLRFVVYDGKIFVSGNPEFELGVFNDKGDRIATIKQEYKRVKVTEDHKQRILEGYKRRTDERAYQFIKQNIVFTEYLPAILNFLISNDKIYVKTYLKKDEKDEYLILDMNGKLLTKVFLPSSTLYSIYNGKFYHLIENEEEEAWELHVLEI